MRHGYYAQMLFSNSGNLVAISTGSDACSEHEQGSAELLAALTTSQGDEASIILALKNGKTVLSPLADPKPQSMLDKLVTALTPAPLQYPDLLESRRITKLSPQLQFIETETATGPEAWLGFCNRPFPCYENELSFNTFSSEADKDLTGAWDSKSFGFRVKGKRYVKALREFHQAMLAGNVAFAGKFLVERAGGPRMGGVMLANTKFISDEDRAKVRIAQAEMESKLRLKAMDDSVALQREMSQLAGANVRFGYLWAGFADKSESSLRYSLNPGYQVKAEYGGPYTREQLLSWAQAKCSYMLKVQRNTETTTA